LLYDKENYHIEANLFCTSRVDTRDILLRFARFLLPRALLTIYYRLDTYFNVIHGLVDSHEYKLLEPLPIVMVCH